MPTNSEQGLPHNIEAEISLLGSAILDPTVIGDVLETVQTESFYRPQNGLIWAALLAMHEKQTPVDIVTLKDALTERNQLDRVGGHGYLMTVIDSVPTSANAPYYAKLIRDAATRRRMIAVSHELAREAMLAGGEVDDLLDKAEREVFALIQARAHVATCSITEAVKTTVEKIASIRDKGSAAHLWGLPSGFRDIDNQTCGFQPGQLIILAGRPSMGKSSAALNILEYLAGTQRKPVALFSVEMAKEMVIENLVCSRARVNGLSMRRGKINDEDFADIARAGGELLDMPLFIDDSTGLSALELRARARRYYADHKIELIVVDYIQMLTMKMSIESRQQEVSMISLALKSLARELRIPVIAVSQLNRAAEQRGDKRPRLSDLRDSGSIEQDADLVMLLYRPGYYTKDDNDKTCEVDIAKQRCGPTGVVKLVFDKELMRFHDAAPFAPPDQQQQGFRDPYGD